MSTAFRGAYGELLMSYSAQMIGLCHFSALLSVVRIAIVMTYAVDTSVCERGFALMNG